MNLFDLAGKLTLDANGFNKGVRDAENAGSSLSDKMSGMFDKIESAAKIFLSGAAVKKIADSVRELESETAAAGDRIDKQSQVLGMSRQEYQEWDYIMSQNGMTIDSMSTSMKTLNNLMLSAQESGGEAADSIAQLGLHVGELEALSQEGQFEAVVKAFQKMPAGAQKSALAVKIFGRQGMQMLPLLNSSATSIDELRAKAQELGFVMSDEAVDASVEYTDALDTMQRTFNGIKYAVGAKLLPAFTNVMEKVSGYAGKLKKAYDEKGFKGVWDTIKSDVENLQYSDSPFIAGLGQAVAGVMNTVETLTGLITDFPGTIEQMKRSDSPFIQGLASALQNVHDIAEKAWGLITNYPETIQQMKESESPFISGLATAIDGVRSAAETAWNLITDFPTTIAQMKQSDSPFIQGLATAIEGVKSAAETAWGLITDFPGTLAKLEESDSPFLKGLVAILQKIRKYTSWVKKLFENYDQAIEDAKLGDDNVLKVIADLLATVKDGFTVLIELINGDWQAAMQTLRDSDSEILSTVGVIIDTFADGKNRIQEFIDTVKEAFGVAGSGGHLYQSFADKMSHSFSESVYDEQSMNEWLKDLRKGLIEAGLSGDNLMTAVEHFQKMGYDADLTGVQASLNSLVSAPYGIQSLLEGWKYLDNRKGQKAQTTFVDTYEDFKEKVEEASEEKPVSIFTEEKTPEEDELLRKNKQMQDWLNLHALKQPVGLDFGGEEIVTPGFSNAKGLWNVPYDDYVSKLHRGEMVLSASQARDYREEGGSRIDLGGLKEAIVAAVRTGLENATVRSFINGRDITDEVNRTNMMGVKARRFAT